MPCVPTNVSAVMACANNTALVSWSASRGAVQYSVTAQSSHSNVSCQTSDLTCSLDNLACGNRYTVQVVAMDDNCSSIPSQALIFNSGKRGNTHEHSYTFILLCHQYQTFSTLKLYLSNQTASLLTAPCPPRNVSAEISCSSNDVTISWDAIREADHFLVSVIADNGGISESCNTTNTACSISNVTCGNTFSVQVTSVRGTCRSQHSETHNLLSGGKTSKAVHPCTNPSIQSPI